MTKNLGLKILSVFLALVMWVYVVSKGQSDVLLEVPIDFKNVPEHLQISRDASTTSISLNIRGHERFLKNLSPDDVAVYLDMKTVPEGSHSYSIKRYNVRVPFPLRFVGSSPPALKVKVLRNAKR